ncbi:hypothetical protein COY25_03745 [Candidatus Uhrbacteria bacterium CG_4_10_14_0_2_um_filter_41_7]|uniref:Uncharacterized protein n=1 Tax=Candidatus Uhrbacteria bacterium CG_4_9_14_3_um_filter_41_35 TaxID=1975034 RepID=A0A2M7XFT6_9BACT|nr:MAG: hypothetical protein COV92_00995 [Candidatus Uhrbacteria bacterium CG11_big_fil_rev_8_21_14_0_20_41_9]PIZ53286.1 MAG: hypothetical protein COY25_03745 [Candidatus Uhrbacteria bacterium CG_4_10_14_0_2_um_filter_41_7]PJA46596.1 MAG: hypothetical protein CO173_02400 [Candidatus Uhrbacteria bacterium CG_4_9_14_3_um_filter_41_35]
MNSYKLNFNTILAILTVVIASSLLVGQKMNLIKHQSAFVSGTEYHRGEVISSADGYLKVDFAGTNIWLDKKTEVKIISGENGQELINVLQGRILIKGKLKIQTRNVITKIDGETSFVHYSWLDDIEIANILGLATVVFDNKSVNLTSPIKLHTLPDYNLTEISFNPELSSSAEFYRQTKK